MLGFTQASWDNLSGEEPQPESMIKMWEELTGNEKAAAMVLGYTELTWDDESGYETQPEKRTWAEMSKCGNPLSLHYPTKHRIKNCI